ncbi:hypothetical protein B0H10DRAFT_2358205, partial [Mycena sp. CBHHK59/15]
MSILHPRRPLLDTSRGSPKPVPITCTPDERLLLRCDGDAPALFSLPYHELVPKLNASLIPLGLPKVACASRAKDGSLFLVSESKEAVKILTDSWSNWGNTVFPGTRIVPPEVYSHIQLDGIPHAAAPDLNILATELVERYPELGPVVGTPTSTQRGAGFCRRSAGSVFIRLESREKVDLAISLGCLRLAGSAPTVARGFPHLRVTQCWGCMKFGHVKARCSVKETQCGGCGEKAHGAVGPSKPKCLNCGGDHRADTFFAQLGNGLRSRFGF